MYSHLWQSQDINIKIFPILQQRLRDQFIQQWHMSIIESPKLEYYTKFKNTFEFENYLLSVENDKLMKLLTCYRLSSHSLSIETGRYTGIERTNRICLNCNQNFVENEYHF
jgi:hypothetical protein